MQPLPQLTRDNYDAFVRSKPVAAVLFDAPAWDKSGWAAMEPLFQSAARELGDSAALGFLDVDGRAEWDVCNAVGITNVPSVAYYEKGLLVAALVGMGQDVVARVRAVAAGEVIGKGDGRLLSYYKIGWLHAKAGTVRP